MISELRLKSGRHSNLTEICGKKRLSLHQGGHCGRKAVPCLPFHHITSNADFLGLFHELTALVHGEDEDGGLGCECVNSTGRVQAVHQGHCDVEDDQVRDGFLYFFDRFQAVGGFVANFEIDQGSEHQTHALTNAGLVVCHQDTQAISLLTEFLRLAKADLLAGDRSGAEKIPCAARLSD